MAQFITKTHKSKGEEVSTTYRIDADFIPTQISDICQEFIENYCVAHNELEWLIGVATKKVQFEKGKDGEKKVVEQANPFVSVRAEFAKKFFPSIVKGSAHKETWAESLLRKYGK